MTVYHGGQAVVDGVYLNQSTWELESVAAGGGILPGGEEAQYIKLPLPVVIAGGPLLGLAYIVLLPILFWLAFAYFLVGTGARAQNSA